MSLWISAVIAALINRVVALMKKKLTAVWFATLATLWISVVIIALIHRVVTMAKKGLMAYWFTTLATMWISAVITAPIHRVVSVVKQKAIHHSHATSDSVIPFNSGMPVIIQLCHL